jgi:predicted acylesterase/phospholipase RssA/CRP-like cAMP-binding protein
MTDPNAEKLALLRANPLFAELEAPALADLAARAELRAYPAGYNLIAQGEVAEALFVVAEGRLNASVRQGAEAPAHIGALGPGDMVGESALLGGGRRTATVIAETDCKMLILNRRAFDAVLAQHPELLDTVADLIHQRARQARLRSLLEGHLPEEAIAAFLKRATWVYVSRGNTVFEDGDRAELFYLVVDGWLGDFARERKDMPPSLRGEHRRGDGFGELELMLGIPRTRTVRALRDCELVGYTKADFDELMRAWPDFFMELIRRLFAKVVPGHARRFTYPTLKIGLLPLHPSIDVNDTARRLAAAVERAGGSVIRAHLDLVATEIDVPDLEILPDGDPNWQRADLWIDRQTDRFSVVIIEAHARCDAWNVRAAAHVDHVIGAAPGDAPLDKTFLERFLCRNATKATRALRSMRQQGGMEEPPIRRSLLMLHPPSTVLPSGTQTWIQAVDAERVFHIQGLRDGDFDRVARLLGGRGFGLVLGGGGARGLAHLGVHRALTEAGIEADFIGGTSMGSIVAAQLARRLGWDDLVQLNRDCVGVNAFREYTLPMFALLRSRKISQLAQMVGGDTDITDLWLPYFAISADITNARMVVHEDGPLWRAIRASGSLPGIVQPVIEGSSLLVDGGIINNVPADVMRFRVGGAGRVIGVNVSPESELPMKHTEFPGPWRSFGSAMVGRRDASVPNVFDILMRSLVLSSIDRMTQVQREIDLLLSPDIQAYGVLDFEKMDEIIETGYRETSARMDEIKVALDPILRPYA